MKGSSLASLLEVYARVFSDIVTVAVVEIWQAGARDDDVAVNVDKAGDISDAAVPGLCRDVPREDVCGSVV